MGVVFFLLLSIAALTSTISLLEVPVSFAIDEYKIPRKKAAWGVGLGVLVISVIVSFNTHLIGTFDYIFSNLGLPIGGLLTCVFVAFVWKTDSALTEMEFGFAGIRQTLFSKVWPMFIYIVCPLAIMYNIITNFL